MRCQICLESIGYTTDVDFLQMPLLGQKVHIAVNSSQAQPGEFFFQFFVEPIRGRVAIGLSQQLQDAFALAGPAIFNSFDHNLYQ